MDKKCPNCGNALPEESSFCLHCFTPLNVTPLEPNETSKEKPKGIIALISLAACVTILISIFACAYNSKSHNDNTTTSNMHTTTTSALTAKQTTTKNAVTTKKKATTKSTTEEISTTASTTAASTSKQQKATKATTKQTTTKKATTIKTTAAQPVIIDGGILTNYPSGRTNSSYTIPYSVTKIENNAFNSNKYLKILKFSKREMVECDWNNLFSNLPNLETVYVYPGTSADLEGLQYFDGEIVYYD